MSVWRGGSTVSADEQPLDEQEPPAEQADETSYGSSWWGSSGWTWGSSDLGSSDRQSWWHANAWSDGGEAPLAEAPRRCAEQSPTGVTNHERANAIAASLLDTYKRSGLPEDQAKDASLKPAREKARNDAVIQDCEESIRNNSLRPNSALYQKCMREMKAKGVALVGLGRPK